MRWIGPDTKCFFTYAHISGTLTDIQHPYSDCFWCPTSLKEIRARALTVHVWF